MFTRSSNFYWKKQLMMLLVLVVVASGFPAAFAPKVAKAEEVNPAPGGVESGLISWIDVEKSVDQSEVENTEGKPTKLNDLGVTRQWTGSGTYKGVWCGD